MLKESIDCQRRKAKNMEKNLCDLQTITKEISSSGTS